jgi:putative flippase GtrA
MIWSVSLTPWLNRMSIYVRNNLFQFVKFGLVGISNTVISYAIYSALVFIGLNYLVSSGIAFL